MWGWGAALFIGVLVLIGGLAWAILATTTNRPDQQNPPAEDAGGPSPARQILDQRYARGELGTEEYRERLQTLGG